MIQLLPGAYQNHIYKVYKYTAYALAALVIYLIAVSLNLFWAFGPMPDLIELENPKSQQSSILYSEDGEELGKYFIENRSPVEFEELSPNLVNALLATEDIRFTKHSGIDPRSLFRVIFRFGQAGGGSTITQQLAKNLFRTREGETTEFRGWLSRLPLIGLVISKTKEWLISIKLESRYTKQEIMKMYLNEVSFGNNAYGIRVAARTYFNKEPRDLEVHEAAMLVGLLQNPSLYDPRLRPERTFERRNTVLGQMANFDFLDRADAEKLMKKGLNMNFKVENQNYGLAPYFREALKPQLIAMIKELNASRDENDKLSLYRSGLRIYTTIDSRMQRYAEDAIDAHMREQQKKFDEHWKGRSPWRDEDGKEIKDFIENEARKTSRWKQLLEANEGDEKAAWQDMKKPLRMRVFSWKGERDTTLSPVDSIKYYKRFLNVGFMAMEPSNGHVKAWVGGINYKYFKYDHVRQSRRQPGSTFKPYVYAAAIEGSAYTPCDYFTDQPVTFGRADGVVGDSWTPKNSEGKYSYASMTMRRAMGRSINSVAAQITKAIKVNAIVQMARDCGITSPLEEVPALCLGSSDVSVFEQVKGYSTFVNEGHQTEPLMILRIEDKKGNVLKEFHPVSKQTITPQTAYTMTYMLGGAINEAGGTAEGLKRYAFAQGNEGIGAKTGTTSNYSDGWFMGITPQLAVGVWVGGDNRSIHFRTISLGQGAKMAMPAFGMFMDKCFGDNTLSFAKIPFPKPQSVTSQYNCVGAADSTSVQSSTEQPKDEDGGLFK